MNLEHDIRELLTRNHVSFAELSRIDEFRGDMDLTSANNPNLIWWRGVSEEAALTLARLREEGIFHYHGTTLLTYLIDGTTLRLPIATRKYPYKTPHWAPVMLVKGAGPCGRQCPLY